MLVLRCTQKLLARVGPPEADAPASTTALGDWFAQPLAIGRRRFVLLVSERSRLPVLMPARDVRHLGANFPDALALTLHRLGVPAVAVDREVDAARDFVIAATNNRSVLGTLNDFSHIMKWMSMHRPDAEPMDIVEWFSDTPVGPLKMGRPGEVARRLLGVG